MNYIRGIVALMLFGIGTFSTQASVDSYRFAHVTISTPWYIFIFLLMGVFAPFILMAVLAWTSATRKVDSEVAESDRKPFVK